MTEIKENSKKKDASELTASEDQDEEIQIIITSPDSQDRGNWGKKMEFILVCIGFAVGLGNVWRFPYLCFKNGGGAFLIPYFTMLALTGLPLYFMESALGQFASQGPITIWTISPMFKGVGYSMVIICFFISVYYNVLIAYCMHYFISSMTSVLPWSLCGNSWNNIDCIPSVKNSSVNYNSNSTSSAEQYFNNHVLKLSSGIEEFGYPDWKLALCLFFSWFLVAVVIIKGISSLGKVSYFTAIFPYIMLTILFVRGFFLPGAMNGIKFYLKPDFNRLLDLKVWTDAATQIFFSLSCCQGGLITMSSFNKFHNECCRDSVLVACLNCATSFYAGFVVFSNLGFMAHVNNVDIKDVAKSGPGLVFIVYPDAMVNMTIPPLWSVLFFAMMLTLGLGSEFSLVETVITGICDELRKYQLLPDKRIYNVLIRIFFCFIMFLLGLTMVTPGGYYVLNMLDSIISWFPLLVIGLMEIVVLIYLYGYSQFLDDIQQMTGKRPSLYWSICWRFITPGILTFLLTYNLFTSSKVFIYNSYKYPFAAVVIGYILAVGTVLVIPLIMLYKFCREGGFIVFREMLKPKYRWGPANVEHRIEFLTSIQSKENLASSMLICSGAGSDVTDAKVNSGNLELNPTNLSLFHSTGNLVGHPPVGMNFYQSKLNIVEKLSHAASKESGLNMAQLQMMRGSSQAIVNTSVHSSDNLTSNENNVDDLVKEYAEKSAKN